MHDQDRAGALGDLAGFRREFYASLTARADVLFELTDAVLCADGPVRSLPELSLSVPHRRGHGALYAGLARGGVEPAWLRRALAATPLPRLADGRIAVAIDVSPWPRPDAETSPDRLHCHRPCRCDGVRQTIPGWPYSVAAALEPGRSSWTALLDARRLGPTDDLTEVTATQIAELVDELTRAGHWRLGDPAVLIVLDSGYDVIRLTWLCRERGLPVELVARVRADRVFYFPAPTRRPGTNGRPPRHGPILALSDPATHPEPAVATSTETSRYGTARAACWEQLHMKLARRYPWNRHPGELPIIAGSLIRLTVDHLPGDRDPKPVWLWSSAIDLDSAALDQLWQTFLRRFDLEHAFRFLKQTLGWTRPRVRTPAAADRWTWLILAAHTQLRLARTLTRDLRRPWEKPANRPARLTPARVRRGFRHLRPHAGLPTSAPKPSRPGPGRPPGRTSTPAPRHPVNKKKSTKDPTGQQRTRPEG